MKHLGKVINAVLTFALFGSLWATNVDTGWIKYTQPNGVTFIGRTWGNEFEHFRETKDGYRFVLNPDDGYYYYARLGAKGDYEASPLKVAIDVPQGIPKGLERSVAEGLQLPNREPNLSKKSRQCNWAHQARLYLLPLP